MIEPAIPIGEASRLEALLALNILDTTAEERFDRLTRVARRLFDVPIALISLVDANRQWFKSCQGLDVSETSRAVSFCGHAILGREVMVVNDATLDERFHDNPLVLGVPTIRFYAGCPLTLADGNAIGTLCLIDTKPRAFDASDVDSLRDLARMAEQELSAVQLAMIDSLTHVANRRGFLALAQHALLTCQRLEHAALLHYFDLDGFKAINDRFGHAEGDRALNVFAGLLRKTYRQSDVIGRLGGDEFAVLATNCQAVGGRQALRRLQRATDAFNRSSGSGCAIGFSVGVVGFDAGAHGGIESLLAAGDASMYESKRLRHAR
jgi:diguanylate cyclase (GGDEF)-like protein